MKIRTAGPADADEIVQVHNAAWREGYRDIVPDQSLAALRDEPTERLVMKLSSPPPFWRTLVAERGPDVVAYITVDRDAREAAQDEIDADRAGEIWALHVHPDRWGKGTGRALLREGHRTLHEFGLAPIRVWVLDANAGGRRFYERYGFTADGERGEYDIDGRAHPIVRLALPKDRLVDDLR